MAAATTREVRKVERVVNLASGSESEIYQPRSKSGFIRTSRQSEATTTVDTALCRRTASTLFAPEKFAE